MPSSTFFNLPEVKQQKIIELAIAEFASHDYDSASISSIVKQAKIAKGSFYQYFEDKQDLYLYVFDLANQQKRDFLQRACPPAKEMELFAYLRWLFAQSVHFRLSHPDLSRIINRAVYGDVPFQNEALKRIQSDSSLYIHQLVEQGIERGDLNASLDPDLVTFVIDTLINGLRFFIPKKLGLSPAQLTQDRPSDFDMRAIEQIFDDLIYVLEHGLGASSIPKS